MSDTTVQQIDTNMLVDLFPEAGKAVQHPAFMTEENNSSLFPLEAETPPAETGSQAASETATGTTEKTAETLPDADILETNTDPAPPKTGGEIADLSSYYQDRINKGTFVKLEIEGEDGKMTTFIPKTPEDYDEVFQLQVDWKLNQAKKELENKWFESKSPAWKVVSKYAEMTDDPTQIIPFLQGVRTLQTVASLDENDIEGAEQIVRTRFQQNNEPEEVINANIDSLKATDKLISTAKQLKPLMLQQQQQQLGQQMKQKEQEEIAYNNLLADIKTNAIKAIEQPLFGKNALKQDEKAAIYDLIGEPQEEQGGFGIFTAIDQLFENKDFDTLRQIALLISKKDAFYNYLGANIANKTAASLEKKLRVAAESRSASGNDFDEEVVKPTVTRNNFNKRPVFGRG